MNPIKVVDNTLAPVAFVFGMLELGTAFRFADYRSRLYIKVYMFGERNAVDTVSWALVSVDGAREVIPVDATLTLVG